MNKFVEKVGVSIASRLGITAAIAAIAAALLGGGYWWVKTQAPRETMKAKETGVKLDVEELAFYGDRDIRVDGKVYRPSETLGEPLPAIIYCQDKSYGESWCRSLAGTGALAYCFDFKGDGEKARVKELETALKGILKLRHVDPDKVYLLGEANGCLTAATVAFDNAKKENQGAHPRLPRLQPAGNQPESQTLQRHHPRRGRRQGPQGEPRGNRGFHRLTIPSC